MNGPITAFYHERYDAHVFAGDDVKYWDGTNLHSLGIALTEEVQFDEYLGDLYFINNAEGLQRLVFTRVNGAVAAGATSVVIDTDGAARLAQFGINGGTFEADGTTFTFTNVDVPTATLTINPAPAALADNTVIVHNAANIGASVPVGKKLAIWKESLHIIGSETHPGADAPAYTLSYGKFAVADQIEDIVDFTNNGYELVGHGGQLRNVVPTDDFLFVFKDDETYTIGVGDVDIVSGSRAPQLLSSNYGTPNCKCAVEMEGDVVWLTQNRRIVKSRFSIIDTGSVVVPDETFDAPVREILDLLDEDQSKSVVTYHKAKKLLYVECTVAGQRLTLVWDNNIGRWLPPDTNKRFNFFYDVKSSLYATDLIEDTIYEIEVGRNDDETPIDCVFAGGAFESEELLDWSEVEIQGKITSPTVVSYEPEVDDSPITPKTFDASALSFGTGLSFGNVPVALSGFGGKIEATEKAPFRKRLANYPPIGSKFQWQFKLAGDAHSMDLVSVNAKFKAFSIYSTTLT